MRRNVLLTAGLLLLAACNTSPPVQRADQEGGTTTTIEIPQATPDGDAPEGPVDDTADANASETGDEDGRPDRVVCKGPDGSVFLDDFGNDMDPSSGRITFTSTTTGEYMAAYGSCVMRGGSEKPAGWKPVIPGGYVPRTEAAPAPASNPTEQG